MGFIVETLYHKRNITLGNKSRCLYRSELSVLLVLMRYDSTHKSRLVKYAKKILHCYTLGSIYSVNWCAVGERNVNWYIYTKRRFYNYFEDIFVQIQASKWSFLSLSENLTQIVLFTIWTNENHSFCALFSLI